MDTKLFELRDHGTFIPLLCIKPSNVLHRAACDDSPCTCGAAFEHKMAWRYGYRGSDSIIVTHMSELRRGCHVDPYDWGDRTFQTAHLHIEKNWDQLKSGDLIDVRVLLGETTRPCESEA